MPARTGAARPGSEAGHRISSVGSVGDIRLLVMSGLMVAATFIGIVSGLAGLLVSFHAGLAAGRLVGTLLSGVLYLWGLGASGWANAFYSAAVQAGSVSWKAFLFGSSDAANLITVDKPPAALWPMAISVKIFGLSSWSILVP